MSPTNNDVYQQRYLAHQEKKKKQLKYSLGDANWKKMPTLVKDSFTKILKNRRTQRVFISSQISDEDLNYVLYAASMSPNSCNRQAILIKVVSQRNEKDLLSGLLVGGVGWCYRADRLLLIFADPQAYKANDEILFMPYLDAGVVIGNCYLAATAVNLGVAYINPNIRTENHEHFNKIFNEKKMIFCGAIALGPYDVKVEASEKRKQADMLI